MIIDTQTMEQINGLLQICTDATNEKEEATLRAFAQTYIDQLTKYGFKECSYGISGIIRKLTEKRNELGLKIHETSSKDSIIVKKKEMTKMRAQISKKLYADIIDKIQTLVLEKLGSDEHKELLADIRCNMEREVPCGYLDESALAIDDPALAIDEYFALKLEEIFSKLKPLEIMEKDIVPRNPNGSIQADSLIHVTVPFGDSTLLFLGLGDESKNLKEPFIFYTENAIKKTCIDDRIAPFNSLNPNIGVSTGNVHLFLRPEEIEAITPEELASIETFICERFGLQEIPNIILQDPELTIYNHSGIDRE